MAIARRWTSSGSGDADTYAKSLLANVGGFIMTAKENFKQKIKDLGHTREQSQQIHLRTSSLTIAAEVGIHFLLAAILSGTVLLENAAPFGVCFVAAAGGGLFGAAALLGASFGYLCMQGFAQGLAYISACILTFAICFAFYDLKVLRRAWAMPILACCVTAFSKLIVLSSSGWTAEIFAHYILELALVALGSRCFHLALAPMQLHQQDRLLSPARQVGTLFLLVTVLMALAPLYLYKDISLGRCLCVLLILCAAWQGGTTVGTLAGVVLGAGMDLAGVGIAFYTLCYALSALAAGLCRTTRRITSALAYIVVDAAAVLWAWNQGISLSILYEVFLACICFMLLPARWLRQLGAWLDTQHLGAVDTNAQLQAREKLESSAQAFATLSESLRSAFRPVKNDNDISTVFDRAAGKVCAGCSLRDRCWNQNYNITFNALNDATTAMVTRGKAKAEDFPRHFADRCLHFPAFVAVVNDELTALLYRRVYNARVRESRMAVCKQYAQLSELIGATAMELSQELTPDPAAERKLRSKLAQWDLDVRTAVFRDARGLLRAQIEGAGSAGLTRQGRLSELSAAMGVPLRAQRSGEDSLALFQQEPLMALAGVAAQKKSGETVSGDAGTYFKRADGKLYVLLCDGMGSGAQANRESTLAMRLLEQFIQAGVQAKQALGTLSSALALRGEECGGFTTVDLLQVDLFTGEGELYKMGAAPTYIKKGDNVQRITGASLPAGLGEGEPERTALDQFTLRLNAGDTVLMVSDGICGTQEDAWIKESLIEFNGTSPKDLARVLIERSPLAATDDRTALVIRIEKR